MSKGFFLRLAVGNIRKHRKIYYPYMLTAVLTVMMLYLISSLADSPDLGSESLIFTLGLGKWVTTFFTLVFLFYTNSFLMKRRQMEFGLLNILGMGKGHIARIICYETLMILLLSLILGLGGGILLDKLLYMLLLRLLGISVGLPVFHISIPALLFAVAIVSGVFTLILFNSIRQIYHSKPIELLHGGQVGEKEPKAKWALALLGASCLGAGYYISLTTGNAADSIMLFFVAVMLVIAGTYLLFTAGSITLLKLLRSSKRFYYQPSHFINVSGMIYRMKQNAVGLANISILSTMVLVIVFSTFSLWFGMEDILDRRCPSDIVLTVNQPERREDSLKLVTRQAASQGLTVKDVQDFQMLEFIAMRQGDAYMAATGERLYGSDLNWLYILPLADYNRLTGLNETLAPDELLLVQNADDPFGDTLSMLGHGYRVKAGMDEQLIKNDLAFASAYKVQWLVAPDQAAMDDIEGLQREAYGKRASAQKYYLRFDAEGGDDAAILALADAIAADFQEAHIGYNYIDSRPRLAVSIKELYGSLLFIGLFLGLLFLMAMILIVYYKQISEGYDDKERFLIMRKVGLSREEIKRSINSQILMVFFLPLITAGLHTVFAFPSIVQMFTGLAMTNVPLMIWCLTGSFLLFAMLYGAVYALTAKVYYRIVS